ncbi:haloacid dehalogenase-like hydrolase [Nocardia amikacinitolerans]|uniref:haloacid dehalogenase-like hydrolase n=1 Tax=Nocardia amikacinitolerans TaxID=756689 RepID=UPI0020A2902B|nr:haloacid dehalogenase-like hydrolase [Nocardia amikacinitolerans]MCP2299374.1 haloacid dehalogenase-like hydrolase [Nocardia amikacinitolerans]
MITKHYHGDDSDVRVLLSGVLAAFAGVTVDEFEVLADRFLRTTRHPTLGRAYLACGYAPMIELLGFLAANGFANYIASGGGRDFMRPISQDVYGIPRERVIGSSVALAWEGGAIVHKPELDVLDDGPQKPVRVWSRIGRRPLLAAGNTNGDIPMLQFTERQDRPTLRLLVRHDDPAREFEYVAGAEQALALADVNGWQVVSIRDDWATVF